ncbi:MAG: type pilus secretin PilQ [Pseudomonadota bacterium]|jgi:type IV pilus assembly protein PilQ
MTGQTMTYRRYFSLWFWLICTMICGGGFPNIANAADAQLKKIGYSVLPGNQIQIELQFNQTAPTPVGFPTQNPARLVFDFPNVQLDVKERFQRVGIGMVSAINAVEANNRTRLVVDLIDNVQYEMNTLQDKLIISLLNNSSSIAQNVAQNKAIDNAPTVPPQTEATPVSTVVKQPSPADDNESYYGPALKNIDFRRGEDGGGRIIVALSQSTMPIEMERKGKDIIVDFKNAHLPEKLDRKLDVTDFATPVLSVDTTHKNKNTIMTITASGDFEYLGYQTDNFYTIEVKHKAPELEDQMDLTKKKYSGERLSLNFQKISVQAVLTLIAEMHNFNVVFTNALQGDMSLRLKNVPWDQAWDIILESNGLGYKEIGNVRMIDSKASISAREKAELEAKKGIKELEPVRTEFIQINYSKASTISALLKSKASGDAQHSFLSKNGNVSVDERTNTLLVQDTSDKLAEIRRLVTALDKPVRQVLIESRVVIASEDFAKDLGVRFGQTTNAHFTTSANGSRQDWGIITGNTSGNLNTSVPVSPTSTATPNDFIVDLPASPITGKAASFGLAIGRVGSYLLQLELSALQSDGRGEVVASPRVITANQQEALIKQGVEVAVQGTAGANAAAAPTFKEVTLELKVTPQITPDDRVIMDLAVKKDNLGSLPGNFERREVKTKVLVSNGETVVLGGVYEQTSSNKMKRIPFFSDLPIIGGLFRNRQEGNSRSELLIFVTPKILKENEVQ